jgi:hypothetical protein
MVMNHLIQRNQCESGLIQYWITTDDTDFEHWCDQFDGRLKIIENLNGRSDFGQIYHWYTVVIADEFVEMMFLLRWT